MEMSASSPKRKSRNSDKAVYDIDGGVLFLTGDTVRLDTAEDTIIARDSLEYYEQRQLAVARGDALAIRDDRRLRADTLTAHFGEGGRRATMERIEALGNVLVSTPTDIVRAEKGDYNPDRGLATLTGNVKITRGKTQLNGERAEVNLKSGESRLLSARPGERVRGLFLTKVQFRERCRAKFKHWHNRKTMNEPRMTRTTEDNGSPRLVAGQPGSRCQKPRKALPQTPGYS